MNEIHQQISRLSASLFDQVKGFREHLHQHPELSYQEFQTADFVEQELRKIGIQEIQRLADTGIVAIIRSEKHRSEDSCIALRADLDALPIMEANEVPYKSKNEGIMHACGHDVHTSILLGTARILFELRNELPQAVKLIFQPGEEKNPGGASLLIEQGVLQQPKVDRIFALHVFPELDSGMLGFREGLYMASCDEIHLTIHGKGGHAARPHDCVDPIYIGANLITQLHQFVGRNNNPETPCVLAFGHFEGLGATNVIPDQVHIKGTFRTMNETWREEALKGIEEQAHALVRSMGGKLDLNISRGYPFLENDPDLTRQLRNQLSALFGADHCVDLPIRLTSEDFSFYAQEIPACFFRLGVRNESKGIVHGVHHPRFDIDPGALQTGMEAMSLAAFCTSKT
ncbi:MAG: amidohydrolase [Bacteroidetes bacterium]|nr:MAG: amidohydrolase [Bacteroidota bacterium]